MYTVNIIIIISTCTGISQQQNFWIDTHFCLLYRASDRVQKKFKLCVSLEANCEGQKIDCAGYFLGLHNFVPNKKFGLPLVIKANIEFFFLYLFFCHNIVKFLQ